jgi:hypothetical protein
VGCHPVCRVSAEAGWLQPTAQSCSFICEAAVIQLHTMAGLSNINVLCHSAGGYKPKIKVLGGMVYFEWVERESAPDPTLASWNCQHSLSCGTSLWSLPLLHVLFSVPLFVSATVCIWLSASCKCSCTGNLAPSVAVFRTGGPLRGKAYWKGD